MPEARSPRPDPPAPAAAEAVPARGPDPSSGSVARIRAPGDLLRALRPREKLFSLGASSLSQAELLALVLGTGTRGEPVTRLAHRLVRRHGLAGLAGLAVEGWRAERGLGSAAAARLAAAFELGRRAFSREGADERRRVSRPLEVFEVVRDLARARKEHLVGLYLDAQNGLIRRETISIGSLNTTRTHPREILYPAVVHLALGFILAHNHPSGCLEPSPEDVEFTRAVRRAGELMGIELYDHLIVAGGGYVSLRERRLL
jgi:DNA repair protein RadC